MTRYRLRDCVCRSNGGVYESLGNLEAFSRRRRVLIDCEQVHLVMEDVESRNHEASRDRTRRLWSVVVHNVRRMTSSRQTLA